MKEQDVKRVFIHLNLKSPGVFEGLSLVDHQAFRLSPQFYKKARYV